MVTGWWDLFLPPQLHDFTRRSGRPGVPARITVGPWLHGEPGELRAIIRAGRRLAGPPPARRPGAARGPPVRVFLQQAGTWLEFAELAAAGAPATALLPARRRPAEPTPSPATPRPSTFVYDPADPTPSAGGPLLQPPGKQADNRGVEARPDVLTFTSARLPADVDLVGPGQRPHLRARPRRARRPVRPPLRRRPRGRLPQRRGRHPPADPRTVPADDVAVGDDGVLAVDVELFPTAYRVRAGHRIRVQVSGGAFPRFARNFGTAEPFATAGAGRRCGFEIYHDAAHPSRLELPVLG